MARNPFQSRDRQHFPAYSPSIFKTPNTPSSTEKNGGFRWSIDHLAVLHPADINTRDMQQDISPSNDVDAQKSVERFFSQRMIVPSPWTQDKALTKHVTFSPHPPDTAYFKEESFNESCNGKMVDASCQTFLTIPLNWDLEAMLGADFVHHDDDEERRIKDCGNTSLRRKLFGQPQRLSPHEDEATASVPCQSTSPISNDVTSPVTTLATGPLLSDNMAATPNIIFTTSPSPSTHHRSSFPVDHSPYHCVSPILTAPVDSQCPPDVDSKGIVSPKLSPIKAKSFVTPDGMTTPNAHPSSGKSTSTPVIKRVQPMATVEEGNTGNNSSQSDSCTDSSGDYTPELLSLEDLRTNTYDFTGVDMAMPSSISDHDNPTVTMETIEGKITKPSTTTTTAATTATTSRTVTMSTIGHTAAVKSVSDSGIAGSSVEMSTQLREDFSNHLQGSCNVNEQLNVRRCDSKLPASSSATLSHNHNSTIAKSNSCEHYKEEYCAADSGLGYNLKTTSHTHNTVQSHLPRDVDIRSVPVSWSSSTVDSSGTANSLRAGFSGVLLPAKYQPPVEESTPKSRYGMPAHGYTNDKNRWAWLPRYNSTNGESFSLFAEEVLLRKEMLKSQLQFGPVSTLCDYSSPATAAAQHSFSRYNGLEYSSSYPPTTPLSSRTTGPTTTAPVRYRSPLSDKVFNKNHSKMNRLHLGSFRSRFNRFTLDSCNATPVSVKDRMSPTRHPSHTYSGRLWSSTERYNDWKRSMDQWEHAIRTQYATVDT